MINVAEQNKDVRIAGLKTLRRSAMAHTVEIPLHAE
jgi:hypothetical protein